jgi:hypothetical protein
LFVDDDDDDDADDDDGDDDELSSVSVDASSIGLARTNTTTKRSIPIRLMFINETIVDIEQ